MIGGASTCLWRSFNMVTICSWLASNFWYGSSTKCYGWFLFFGMVQILHTAKQSSEWKKAKAMIPTEAKPMPFERKMQWNPKIGLVQINSALKKILILEKTILLPSQTQTLLIGLQVEVQLPNSNKILIIQLKGLLH